LATGWIAGCSTSEVGAMDPVDGGRCDTPMQEETLPDGCTECVCEGERWSCHDACAMPECQPGETKLGEGGCYRCACDATGQWDCPDIECQACMPGDVSSSDCFECVCNDEGTWTCNGFLDGNCGSEQCEPGQSYPAGDDCNVCLCNPDRSYSCTMLDCENSCPAPVMRSGNECSTRPAFARTPDMTGGCCEYSSDCEAPPGWLVFPTHEECVAGRIRCVEGTADCDDDATNGCETDIASDGQNCGGCGVVCTAAAGGSAICSSGRCAGEAATCTYLGVAHPIGESFPSRDDCNTCTCVEAGMGAEVSCTTRECACDPAAESRFRNYVGSDAEECLALDYECPNHTTPFTNECGCGCEQSVDCPETSSCPIETRDPVCADLRERCPYTAFPM
jgi:hypothetical protein